MEIKDNAMFSSKSDDWATPIKVFNELNDEFGFDLDVCASHENHKVDTYFTKEDDGLSQCWYNKICFMNPPYGRAIGHWVEKAYFQSVFHKATVVCLLPARTDTRWFHNYCLKGEVRFIKGRLKFGDAKENAPFPNMIVIFRPDDIINNKEI